AGLLALTGVLGIGEGHLFHHRKARRLVSGDFAKSGSLFQDFPSSVLRERSRRKASVLTTLRVLSCGRVKAATSLFSYSNLRDQNGQAARLPLICPRLVVVRLMDFQPYNQFFPQ
ncbi:hypothetical protein, partial [Pseudomonas aeruginosa]